jgi:hypothetical protein
MTDTTPADENHVDACMYESRQAIARLVDLYFNNVPVDELDRGSLTECIYEGLSDELDRLYQVDAEHRVARQILGTTEQQPAPVDQAALRDRIAVLLAEKDGWEYAKGFGLRDMSEATQQHYDKLAAAVLSVLPTPVDQSAA